MLTPEQIKRLEELAKRTEKSKSSLIAEGVEELFRIYRNHDRAKHPRPA
jgi:predicted DNA-binding protein